MATTEPGALSPTSQTASPLALLGLLLSPIVSAGALFFATRCTLSEDWGLGLASAIAIVPAIVGLRIAARAPVSFGYVAVVGIPAIVILAWLFAHGLTHPWLMPLQNVGLVALGHAVGAGLGRRIEHPGHALPAMVVAAAADIASVVDPAGPSHAIASSDRALAALALAAPIPGSNGLTFVLGVGDLIFAALLLGVAVRHGLSVPRVAILVMAGAGIGVAAAAILAIPIPALVPIGALCVGGVPEFRRLARRDKATAQVAILIALAVVVGLFIRSRFSAH